MFNPSFRHVVLVVSALGLTMLADAQGQEAGWSADLLSQILKAEPAPASKASAPSAAPAEMVLRTYHLSHLRLGEAGRAQNVTTILQKLLPPGSTLNSDIPANSLHLLTTAAAHQAAWEYLSAVDVAEPTATAPAAVPEDVRAALQKLADTGEQSARILSAVGALKTDVSHEFAAIDARQRGQTLKLLGGIVAFAVLLTATVAWMMRRRAAPSDPAPTAALAVMPDQLATALTPVHDKMRNDMLGLLNEVAIKLQAQHQEQQKLVREQQLQLEDARQALAAERRQFITEAGSMVVQAVERVDATTARLAQQQDRVSELVEELQKTVSELDHTKDNLRDREIELEQERAKIAALSLLLEEGGALDATSNGHAQGGAPRGSDGPSADGAAANGRIPFLSCTTPDHATQTEPPSGPPLRFTFLPPDNPES